MKKKLPLLAWAFRSNQRTAFEAAKWKGNSRSFCPQTCVNGSHGRFGEGLAVGVAPTRLLERSSSSLSCSSSFVPPEPPSSNGQAVFEDIEISIEGTSEASIRNSDPHAVFVVTGASRGIGLQFVKSLLHRTKGIIVACCRSPSTARGLNDFLSSLDEQQLERIVLMQVDLEDASSIQELGIKVKEAYNRVDVLLNVAGILGDGDGDPGPERSIRKIDPAWLQKSLAINTVAPLLLSQSMAPMMRVPKQKSSSQPTRAKSIIVNLSARVGSISDNNGLGGWYSYRISKSALNMATRTMSHELKRQGTWTLSLHPGTTDTDLSQPFQKNVVRERLFPVDFTVQQLCNIMDSMKESHSGGFYDWAGKALPF